MRQIAFTLQGPREPMISLCNQYTDVQVLVNEATIIVAIILIDDPDKFLAKWDDLAKANPGMVIKERTNVADLNEEAKAKGKSYVDYNGRRSGRTTRLADHYVQVLFTQSFVDIIDHYQASHHGNDHLYKLIRNRLLLEHPSIDVIHEKIGTMHRLRLKHTQNEGDKKVTQAG